MTLLIIDSRFLLSQPEKKTFLLVNRLTIHRNMKLKITKYQLLKTQNLTIIQNKHFSNVQ